MAAGTPFHRLLWDDAQMLPDEKIKLVTDDKIRRVVICSGKVYYDLYEEREKRGIDDVYLLRVEQLYPFPLKALVRSSSGSRRPTSSGARRSRATWARWTFVEPYSNGCSTRSAPSDKRAALRRPSGLGLDRDRADVEAPRAAQGSSSTRRWVAQTALPAGRTLRQKVADTQTGARTWTEIRVPTLGESVTEATIGKWFKKPGDAVAVDEPLVELETDKVTLEVPAPAAGVLADIAAKDGETVEVGALLGQIKDGAGAAPAGAASSRAADRAAPSREAKRRRAKPPRASRAAAKAAAAACRRRRRCASSRPKAASTPPTVAGTGKDGRVTKGDMLAAIERAAAQPTPVARRPPVQVRAPSPADDAAREERVRMTRLRQTIARRLKDAQNTAAMLTTFNEVDMTAVMALRTEYKDLFEKKHGIKLGFMGFFVQPACRR